MKKSICHIRLTHGFGGAERQVYMLVKTLRSRLDQEQSVLVIKDSDIAQRLKVLPGVKLLEATKRPMWKRFLTHGSLAFRPLCARLIKNHSMIHAHEEPDAKVAYLANRYFGTPFVLTKRGCRISRHIFRYKKIWKAAGQIVTVSDAGRQLFNCIYPEVDTRTIYSSCKYNTVVPDSAADLPINDSKARAIKKEYLDKFLIGHIARLHNKCKGQSHTIEVAKALYDRGFKGLHFLFIGEGESRKELQKLAGGYPNIEFIGFKDNIGDYYRALDLFVFPSISEGLGSAILDAFALKVPVVASDTGGIPELVKHEETGLLHGVRNDTEFYDAIIRMYSDEKLRRKTTERAFKFVQDFTIERQADQYLKVYESVIAAKKQRS